jgi:tetratricopeptide (TPR) repeat protein
MFSVIILSMIAIVPPLAAQEETDVIITKDSRITGITILKEQYDFVTYKMGGTMNAKIKSSDIRDIQRNSLGQRFRTADANRRAGRYQAAIDTYKTVLTSIQSRSKRDRAKPVVKFLIAECLLKLDKSTESKKEYDAFLKDYARSKHFFIPAAHHGLARLYMDKKSYDSALKEFKTLATTRNFGSLWNLRGELGEGIVKVVKGLFPNALKIFERVEVKAKSQGVSDIEQEAKMWQGKCLLGSKDYRKAVSFFKNITDATNVTDREVMASAYNGLGTAYWGLSKKGSDRELVHKALMAHLRVVLVYSGVRSEYLEALKLAVKEAGKLGLERTARELKQELDAIQGK